MKRIWNFRGLTLLLLAGLVLIAYGVAVADQQPGKVPNVVSNDEALMALKLASSQKALEGLVEKDFVLIRKAGEELKRLEQSKVWRDVENGEYTHFRIELARQADKLVQMAEAKNLDGAAFTYMNMVSTCINCHNHCRDVLKIADLNLGLPATAVAATR